MSNGWQNDYHEWLLRLIEEHHIEDPEFSHTILLERLSRISYSSPIKGDRNRADDGVYLRWRFENETGHPRGSFSETHAPPSFLEVFIALAERMYFGSTNDDLMESVRDCFWLMMSNMNLESMVDAMYMDDPEYFDIRVDEICSIVIEHKYTKLGVGGPFPVTRFTHVLDRGDARRTELWYQMQGYLLENAVPAA